MYTYLKLLMLNTSYLVSVCFYNIYIYWISNSYQRKYCWNNNECNKYGQQISGTKSRATELWNKKYNHICNWSYCYNHWPHRKHSLFCCDSENKPEENEFCCLFVSLSSLWQRHFIVVLRDWEFDVIRGVAWKRCTKCSLGLLLGNRICGLLAFAVKFLVSSGLHDGKSCGCIISS